MKRTIRIDRLDFPAASRILVAVALLTTVITGCSEIEFGGGATVVPKVTILPPDLGGEKAAASGGLVAATGGASIDAASIGKPGTLTGRVVLVGAASSLPFMFVKGADIKDKEVCAAVDVPDERLVLGADNGVANVFVYLKKAPNGTPKLVPGTVPMIFDQKNCRFLPRCMVVPIGQTVSVLSDDGVAHNTHTNPQKNQGVSSLVSPNDRVGNLQLVYSRSEDPFSVTCDFHTWMKAYHLPLDHPYGAVTDENGNFEIADLPAGEHELVVWHESAKGQYVERKLKVSVQPGENPPLEIPYSVDKLQL